MARTWVRLFAGATLTLSLTGHALADEGKITVFAAASLTNALQDIAAAYKKEKNVEVVSSFCLFFDARSPDRSGRAGGSVHLG